MQLSNVDQIAGFAFLVILLSTCGAILLFVAGLIYIHYLLYTIARAIPAPHRKLEPWTVWLLLIPFFKLVWNFMVFQGISDGYKSYFESRGQTHADDYGRSLGITYSITDAAFHAMSMAGSIFPPLGCMVFLPFILKIACIVQLWSLKNRLEADAQSQLPVEVI